MLRTVCVMHNPFSESYAEKEKVTSYFIHLIHDWTSLQEVEEFPEQVANMQLG